MENFVGRVFAHFLFVQETSLMLERRIQKNEIKVREEAARKIPRSPLRSSQGTYLRRYIETEKMKCYILLRARVPLPSVES